MRSHWPVIIIGGGAAGLYLSGLMEDCLLLEKRSSCGLKLRLTGGGACNLAHEGSPDDFSRHFHEKRAFVAAVAQAHPTTAIRQHFKSLGVDTITREDDKVFPRSGRSQDVVDALLSAAKDVITDCKVEEISKGGIFTVKTTKGIFTSDRLVIATGGMSVPSTGSEGDGYALAASFGHKIIPVKPALCRIKLADRLDDVEGITVPDMSFTLDGHIWRGPVLFTRTGISGPAVMNASRFVEKGMPISLHFAAVDSATIRAQAGKKKALGAIQAVTGLPSRLVQALLPPDVLDKQVASLSKNDMKTITGTLADWKTTCSTEGELPYATVTRGGVDTKDIKRKTMESRLVEGLYIIGECLDVDGECGGYNLSFAFMGAHAVASSIRKAHPLPAPQDQRS